MNAHTKPDSGNKRVTDLLRSYGEEFLVFNPDDQPNIFTEEEMRFPPAGSGRVNPRQMKNWRHLPRMLQFLGGRYGLFGSGRLISDCPLHVLKLQDSDDAMEFRKAFQLRLLAHLSQDKALIEMFQTGRDHHDETRKRLAAKGIGIRRVQAKADNFTICYGGTAWIIQSALGCELSTAHRIVRELSAIYPGVAKYLDSIANAPDEAPSAYRHVNSLWGRRRSFYYENSPSDREIGQAKNAVVQMLEADVFKITLLELHRAFKTTGLPVKIVLLLHDGIWFTCPAERATVARVGEVIKKIVENCVRLSVPLKVGLTWHCYAEPSLP